jgi:hypothetical protein
VKTTLTITVEVNYPTIDKPEARHTLELGETRSSISRVVSDLQAAFFLDKMDSYETIGAAKVNYTYKVEIPDGICPQCKGKKHFDPIDDNSVQFPMCPTCNGTGKSLIGNLSCHTANKK